MGRLEWGVLVIDIWWARLLNFANNLGEEEFILDESLDEGIVDFVLFEDEVLLLGLLQLVLELDEFIL